MKVVYNARYGGFFFSDEAAKRLKECWLKKGMIKESIMERCGEGDIRFPNRTDPDLVRIVEEMGRAAGYMFSDLRIVDIPDEYEFCYEINEYDGLENVVCNPAKLMRYELEKLDAEALNEERAKNILLRWKALKDPFAYENSL